MQRLLLTFFVLLMVMVCGNAFAATKKTPLKIISDTSKISARHFDQKALDKYKADKDFDYSGQSIGKPSVWQRFWSWVWYQVGRLFDSIPYSGTALKYFFAVLAVAFLAFVIFKSLGIDPITFWRGEAAKIAVPYSESLEDIHGIDFDAEIERAVVQHNFRLAVRLLYLKCLKQLSDKDLIEWQPDKTNTAYILELKAPEQKRVFGLLTRQFEFVWYGNFAINKQAYTNIDMLFTDFKKQLP